LRRALEQKSFLTGSALNATGYRRTRRRGNANATKG